MGVPSRYSHYHLWVAVIPNSQLIMFPYPITDPDDWTLELFINPSASLLMVSAALAILLGFLGVLIFVFHVREKREDEAEKHKGHLIF
jgi:integrin alpha FG-GAP repeat containing protein 1